MCAAVDMTCTEEAAVVGSLPALQNCHNELKFMIAKAKDYLMVQASNIKGWTKAKRKAKMDMIQKTMKLSNGGAGWALANNDLVLYREVNFSVRKLVRKRDEEVDVICELVNSKCSGVPGGLSDFGVTSADFAAQLELVENYRKLKQKPTEKENEQEVATEGLASTIVKIRGIFKVMDKVVRTLEDTETDFVTRYFKSREIYDL